ncbi:MAG: hypothetical protein Kow0022_08650 [Phycisphaerales bacterium]
MSDEKPISRRDLFRGRFLRTLVEKVSEAAGERFDAAQRAFEQSARPSGAPMRPAPVGPVLHRPPCAVDELTFTAQCTRCDACVRACPVGAITHAEAIFGKAVGTPIIQPRVKACVMCDDLPCVAACQREGTRVLHSGLSPKMGVARVIIGNCVAYQGGVCDVCVRACPVEGALVSHSGVPIVHESLCTGCGLCQQECPAPRNAIALIVTAQRPAMPAGDGDHSPQG